MPNGINLQIFQSTSSAWRTTGIDMANFVDRLNFNPRPPHGGRLDPVTGRPDFENISIHVLRMEDDSVVVDRDTIRAYFNPRPPHGGRQC